MSDLGLVVPGGATALLAVVFLLVVRGYLVPPRLVHRDEYDRVKAERDAAWSLAMRLLDQNQELLGGTRVVVDALQAVPTPARREG